jgi:two-component system, sensor histidine kinase
MLAGSRGPGHDSSIEAKLRVAFELSPMVLVITTAGEGRILDVNDAFLHLHGYSREEVLGRTVSELNLWVDPQQRRQALALIAAGSPVRNLEARLRTKEGSERVCILNADLVVVDGRRCIMTALTDITDRVRAEQSLRGFLAMLGHELRNPLGTIRTATALLERSALADRDRRVIDVVNRQTAQLSRLVDDLLDMSRLTSGNIRLQRHPLDLHALAGRCIDTLRHGGRAAGHDVILDGEATYVDGDEARLEQVVNNLLDNAIKYTPAGGRVTVSTSRTGDEAIVRVRDTGKGIDPKLLPRVFDLFVQEPQALDRAQGGLGLGLAIVKGLVALHGGSVSAESAGPGQGSEVTIRLPAAGPVAAHEPTGPTDAARDRVQRRVLVVEDNADAREMLQVLLEASGHIVQAAADGPSGLAALRSFHPDVALIDVGLPGMDGYELARSARRHPETCMIRLVALTGYGQAEDRERAHVAGFDQHVTKPVNPEALAQLVSGR